MLNCAPASTTAISAKPSMFTGRPQKLPTLMVRRSGQLRVKSQKLRIMVPYSETHSAAAPSIFSHMLEPLGALPLDQEIDRPLRQYIQPARPAKATRMTGPARDSKRRTISMP
ncbi:hypothetical protein D3C77_545120 [compost metagenome]